MTSYCRILFFLYQLEDLIEVMSRPFSSKEGASCVFITRMMASSSSSLLASVRCGDGMLRVERVPCGSALVYFLTKQHNALLFSMIFFFASSSVELRRNEKHVKFFFTFLVGTT